MPEPDQAERLLRNLYALERTSLPLSVAERAIRSRYVPGGGEHQTQRVLGGGDGVALGGVGDQDAALGSRFDVYVVHPDAGPADRLQVVGGLYYLGGDLGGAPDYESVVFPDLLGKLFRREAEQHVDFELLL